MPHGDIVEQRLMGDFWIVNICVHQQQRLAAVVRGCLTRHVISDGFTFSLKVVMLARTPARILSRVGDMFQPAEPPNDIALPIDLDQIGLILETMIRVAQPRAAKDLTVRQQLVGKALQAFPQLDLPAIHIDQQSAEIRGRKNGVSVPRLGGIVQSDAGWIDRWVAHRLSYPSKCSIWHAGPLRRPVARSGLRRSDLLGPWIVS